MIGIPIRITVVFLILALTVPIMIGFIGDFRKDTEVSDLLVQAEIVSETAKKTYYSGVGGIFTADIFINSKCRLDIGGENSDGYEIKMVHSDKIVGIIAMDRPPVRISEPISITGNLTLKFECIDHENRTAVKVSVF